MSEQYTYAVARIRALEVSLFSDSTIDQLIACQNYDQALQFLEEKGWGDARKQRDAEKILTREEEKTWEVVKELSIGMEHFDVLSYPKLFHNLKAAVKEVCTGDKNRHIYYEDVRIPGEEMRKDRRRQRLWKASGQYADRRRRSIRDTSSYRRRAAL